MHGADTRERVLKAVLEEALARPEVAEALTSEDVSRRDLEDAVAQQGDDVFVVAEGHETRYRSLRATVRSPSWPERHLAVAKAVLLLVVPTASFGLIGWLAFGRTAGVAVAVVSALLGAVSWRRYRIEQDGGVKGDGFAILGGFALLVAAVFGGIRLAGWSWSLVAALIGAGLLVVAWLVFIALTEPGGTAVANRVQAFAAFVDWRRALLDEGVLPALYLRINEAKAGFFSTTLTVRDSSALGTGDHLAKHVPTPASARLKALVAASGGGSFAVAGPRGAGKTNLLRAFCGGRYRVDGEAQDLAVLVAAPVEYKPHEFVVHLFAEVCEAVIARFTKDEARDGPSPVVVTARLALQRLDYVRSVNNEVSGKGGFRGFELAGKRAVTLAGRAWTYPEVVKQFRQFLAVVVKEVAPGRVVIGIDELDRIGEGEPARRFLNEIKAVFDVPGCHYLVSVSTEAQHDFELSGLGLRSVFDSSFDEVVRVDFLDHEYARRLLRRYVLGLSEQFHALAYAFSGGLARQLVRVARAIADLGAGRSLSDVAHALAHAELVRACQATADALAAVDDRDGVSRLLRLLDERPAAFTVGYGDRVLDAYDGESGPVGQLRDALGARIRFLETVVAVFTDALDADRMADIDFDHLARARRYVGSNPRAALGLLEDLRRTWAL
ncbi:P-loop NTPase family protein [Saccharothrix variisporea]|uniref:hypothetical protein n=1 Tax=Saccharothrix variisporea TaxID=543527 RepID=UPI0011C3FDFA|nr:hypothetical protein [Saccharothrix variisporea]